LECVDETVNTLKFAERAQHITTQVHMNKISAVDNDLVEKLQKEIKYLKDILNIRRKGTAVHEVHNKLLMLQEENDRLRKDHVSVQEVENLMEENQKMKLQLQNFRTSQTGKEFETEIQDTSISSKKPNFNANLDESSYRMDNVSEPSTTHKNTENKRYHMPSATQLMTDEDESKSQMMQRQKFSSLAETPLYGQKFNRNQAGSTRTSELAAAGRQLLEISKRQSNMESPPAYRIKGLENYPRSKSMAQPPDLQKIDHRKKEQARALERLKELEKLQNKQQERLQKFAIDENSFVKNSPDLYVKTQNSMGQKQLGRTPTTSPDKFDIYKIREMIDQKYKKSSKEQLIEKR